MRHHRRQLLGGVSTNVASELHDIFHHIVDWDLSGGTLNFRGFDSRESRTYPSVGFGCEGRPYGFPVRRHSKMAQSAGS